MNKKPFLLTFIVILCGIVAYYLFTLQSWPEYVVSPIPKSQSNPTSTVIHVPIDIFGDRKSFGEFISLVKNSTGIEISFRGRSTEARNPTTDVYINQDKIGEVVGQDIALLNSSPDKKYFAFRSRSVMGCAGTCHSYYVYVVDVANKKFIDIRSPRLEHDYSGYAKNPQKIIVPFIESYAWGNNSGLNITFYFVTTDDGGYNYYRVSPKELWRYDFATKQYKLLETLPE